MAVITENFTATGTGPSIFVRKGEQFTYAVAGTFVGTVKLYSSENSQLVSLILSATGSASGTVYNTSNADLIYYFKCTAFTSGTIETSLTDVAETILEIKNAGGVPVVTVNETGLTNTLSSFAATTSAELAGVISNETGTGALVFGTSPTFTSRISAPEIRATDSSGIDFHNNSGTQVAIFGAGGSTGASIVGAVNIGSASADYVQITGVTGSGTVTATGSSTDVNIVLTPKGAGDVKVTGADLVMPKTSGVGIKVDTTAPTFGWRDITSEIDARGTGPNDPTFATYTGTAFFLHSFSATTMQQVWIVFHVPHDYVPGTDIYFHTHWSNPAASPNTGNVIWGFEYSYAKGHQQAAFPASSTVTVTQACNATRYHHHIAETAAVTITGMEVDGLIMVRIYRDAAAGGDTCTDAVFLHTADIHYQSTNMTTKNKAPNFYT